MGKKYIDIKVFDGDDDIKYVRYEDMLNLLEQIRIKQEEKNKEIENLKQEVERLKNINEEHRILNGKLRVENNRLNNIINELEKWLEERLDKLDINGYDDDVFNGIELALHKLQELKGSDK